MTQHQTSSQDALAQGLGWFSIALGTAELMAPETVSRALGMEDRAGLVQAYGVREIATGIAILASDQPKPWLWGRVAGDALDLATLATGLNDGNPRRANVRLAMGGVAAVTLLDLYAASSNAPKSAALPSARPMRDYSDRSGFPDTPENMRGAALRKRSTVSDTAILNPLI